MKKIDLAIRKLEITLDVTNILSKDLEKLFTMKSFPAKVKYVDIPNNGEDDDIIDIYFHIDLGSREAPIHLYSYCFDLFDETKYNTLDYSGRIYTSRYSKIDLARLRIARAIYELTSQVLGGEVDTECCVEVLINPDGTFRWER